MSRSSQRYIAPAQCGYCKHEFLLDVPAVGIYKVDCSQCDHAVTIDGIFSKAPAEGTLGNAGGSVPPASFSRAAAGGAL